MFLHRFFLARIFYFSISSFQLHRNQSSRCHQTIQSTTTNHLKLLVFRQCRISTVFWAWLFFSFLMNSSNFLNYIEFEIRQQTMPFRRLVKKNTKKTAATRLPKSQERKINQRENLCHELIDKTISEIFQSSSSIGTKVSLLYIHTFE